MMEYIYQYLYASLAVYGYALLFSTPKRTIFPATMISGISWLVYYHLHIIHRIDNYYAIACSAFILVVLSEMYANFIHENVIVTILPSILPIVPGTAIFSIFMSALDGDINHAIHLFLKSCGNALIIAFMIIAIHKIVVVIRKGRTRYE